MTFRYYAADLLLAENSVALGDVSGGTTGHTCIGASKLAGVWQSPLGAQLDELRVVDYEMSHDEVRETWRRLSIHQPNGIAMFAGNSPPGVRWYKNPGNSIAAFVKVVGELLGYAIAKIEELRANFLPDQAYVDIIARWEGVLKLSAKPNDSLDTRRARVIAFLSRLRGYSVPAIQQVLTELLGVAPSQIQILQFSNLITDTLATLNTQRWQLGATGAWSIVGGQLQIAASSGADFSQYPISPCFARTSVPATSMRRTSRGPGSIVAQVELASVTLLPTNELVGIHLRDDVSNDALWFGVKQLAGHREIGYQIFRGGTMQAYVTLLNPAPATPVWLRVRPQTLKDAMFTPLLGYSTTGPTTGFTETVGTIFTLNPPGSAGMGVIGPSIASSLQATFANFALLAHNGDRPFQWYAFRDPALGGSPDIAGAQLALNAAKPAHTRAGVCQNVNVLYDDTRYGLYDRGPMGGI